MKKYIDYPVKPKADIVERAGKLGISLSVVCRAGTGYFHLVWTVTTPSGVYKTMNIRDWLSGYEAGLDKGGK